ncbi:MAG: CvpA family protein [Terracidiphilus sp.]
MTWVDWAIVIVLAVAVLAGLSQGFFRSVCSLGGLILGLAVAAWNYGHLAAILLPIVRIRTVADAIGFLLIAIAVMLVIGLLGAVLAKALRLVGLGWLDALAGGAFGFLQGALLVTIFILVTVAFFPQAEWLTQARLPQMFFSACRLSTHMTPAELAERVRSGLDKLERESPRWMHPEATGG